MSGKEVTAIRPLFLITLLIPAVGCAALIVNDPPPSDIQPRWFSQQMDGFLIPDTYTGAHPGADALVTWSYESDGLDYGSLNDFVEVSLEAPGQSLSLGTGFINPVLRPGGCLDGIQDSHFCVIGLAIGHPTLLTGAQLLVFAGNRDQWFAQVTISSEWKVNVSMLTRASPFTLSFSDPSPDPAPASNPWLLMAGGIVAIALRLKGQQQSS